MFDTYKDCIILKDLQAFCRLGTYTEEHALGQNLNINLVLEIDLKQAGIKDDVKLSTNYVDVSIAVRTLCQSRIFYTLENLAHEICTLIFDKFAKIDGIQIEITKTIVNAVSFTGTPIIRIYRTRA
ncbi:MAG: dihydroneopterin aldolase [Candidatus Caenarcaniphilales bacterium]|jgi:dihydroneopterin aldolase|nr:dihydroneopterin aldolase [Candidatus Caenarcaniphilales bacterium]